MVLSVEIPVADDGFEVVHLGGGRVLIRHKDWVGCKGTGTREAAMTEIRHQMVDVVLALFARRREASRYRAHSDV